MRVAPMGACVLCVRVAWNRSTGLIIWFFMHAAVGRMPSVAIQALSSCGRPGARVPGWPLFV